MKMGCSVLLVFWLLVNSLARGADDIIDLDELQPLEHTEKSCDTVRLDSPGGPVANVPVRDQGAVGSCTAHATAVMIDAHLAKKYPPPSIKGPRNHLTQSPERRKVRQRRQQVGG